MSAGARDIAKTFYYGVLEIVEDAFKNELEAALNREVASFVNGYLDSQEFENRVQDKLWEVLRYNEQAIKNYLQIRMDLLVTELEEEAYKRLMEKRVSWKEWWMGWFRCS